MVALFKVKINGFACILWPRYSHRLRWLFVTGAFQKNKLFDFHARILNNKSKITPLINLLSQSPTWSQFHILTLRIDRTPPSQR